MKLRSSAIALTAALGAALAGGCKYSAAPLEAWCADDMVHLTDRTSRTGSDTFDPDTGTIKTFAAANETVSFQIVIDAGAEPATDLTIRFTDFVSAGKAKIDSANVRAFRMWPVNISTWPPWYLRLASGEPVAAGFYDPLTPIDSPRLGQPFQLAGGDRLALWVDLYVPRSAMPGLYVGQVMAVSTNRPDLCYRIKLRVYDFVLPDSRPIAAVGGFDHATLFSAMVRYEGRPYVPDRLDRRHKPVRGGLTIMRQLMRLAHQHRLDLFDRGIRPVLKRDEFGKVRIDWTDYDAIVMPYLTGSAFDDRIGCAAWPVPFHERWPSSDNYGGPDSQAYADTARQVIAACREHLAATDEMAEQIFVWPYRGEVTAEAYARHERLAKLIRSTDPATPILTQLPPSPPPLTRWPVPADMAELADIFAPKAEWLEPGLARRFATPSNPLAGVWLSPGKVPYLPGMGLLASPADLRALPWFAMKYNCTGLFIPEVLNWSGPDEPAEASSPGRLFYPGTALGLQTVLPSVRLKRLRRGLQDIAYIWLLKQRNWQAAARLVTDSMVHYAGLDAVGDNYLDCRLDGWVKDGPAWRRARRLMAEEIQAIVHPETYTDSYAMESQLAWQRFCQDVRAVRLEQCRTAVRPAAGVDGRPGLQARIRLELYNERSRAVEIVPSFGRMPAGWHATRPSARVVVPAGRREIVELFAAGPYIPADDDGRMPLPVELEIDGSRKGPLPASIAFLQAGLPVGPVTIDGRLDDWPMRPSNCASAFKLIGRRGRTGSGLARRQTAVFVLRGDDDLYVAFRCREPTPEAMFARRDNIVRYEQLMATGEDMVEVILDPGASAGGVEDLYRIVVKCNGVLIAERGVASDPPLGNVRPWAARALAAVGSGEDHWVAELAIPLSSFGQAGKERFWAVNFTRFATQGAEASSWSGPVRHFYDPRNLGAMLLPPRRK